MPGMVLMGGTLTSRPAPHADPASTAASGQWNGDPGELDGCGTLLGPEGTGSFLSVTFSRDRLLSDDPRAALARRVRDGSGPAHRP